jgi:hypothetical protein
MHHLLRQHSAFSERTVTRSTSFVTIETKSSRILLPLTAAKAEAVAALLA